ncbi:GNAT family N-acetyltransferase [Companilactobacillus insicii]|uniref:GNAT family N-acetyltransferase n=1 Tax=Companilactobacillus insicii TaxID=1732567 RepID=UPI000F7836A3|nr:GNAT family N-acetyltransferase [Companilactobacillus insicii]
MFNVFVRKAHSKDLEQIIKVINDAKNLIKGTGSPQWQDGEPSRAVLEEDLKQGRGYVLMVNGDLVGYTCLMQSDDPHYAVIQDGSWNNTTDKYATLHRVAIGDGYRDKHLSDFLISNMFTIGYGLGFRNFRIDTHEMNKGMQYISEKFGFKYRGIIYVGPKEDDRRLAYELNM